MPDDFDPGVLRPAERIVLAKVKEGVDAQFGRTEIRVVRGAFLRHLLLRLPTPGSGKIWPVQLTGVRIEGACIEGSLDLSYAAMAGIGLPTLTLKDCDIPAPIKLAGARISSLSVAGSRFKEIILRDAEIDGLFDFSDAEAFDPIGEFAWIDASSATINGSLTGDSARLRAPKKDQSRNIGKGRIAALRLVDADIRGSILLRYGFVAEGGVSLNTAHVRGDVLMARAKLTAGDNNALSAENVRIGGMVALQDGFTACGTVWLYGASIGGCLFLSRAKLRGRRPVSEPDYPLVALVAENTEIGGPLLLNQTKGRGQIRLQNARIRGDIVADGVCLRYPAQTEPAVLAEGITVGGNFLLRGGVIAGRLDLTGAHIGGRFALDGTQLCRTTGKDDAALLAVNATVGKDVEFRRCQSVDIGRDASAKVRKQAYRKFAKQRQSDRNPDGERQVGFRSAGKLGLTGIRIAGDLSFEGSCLANRTPDGKGAALSAERIRVEGSLEFACGFVAEGEVNLAGASIDCDLKFKEANFVNSGGSAIYAKDLAIRDDLHLIGTNVEGDLRLERMNVSGSMKWCRLAISGRGKGGGQPQLDLRHARVGSALKAESLEIFADQATIDLRGMEVATIQDWTVRGWGIAAPTFRAVAWWQASPATKGCRSERLDNADARLSRVAHPCGFRDRNIGPACQINFDGFRYERIELASELEPSRNHALRARFRIPRLIGPPRHPRADPLLDWILHQPCVPGDPKVSFFPQPYRQLARVLRSQGEEDAAVRVAIAERWAAPREGVSSWLRWLFGICFGFGLRRTRASVTLLLYIAVGTFGVWEAHNWDMLVEATMVTAPAFMTETPPNKGVTRVFLSAQQGVEMRSDIPCTDTAGGVEADLVYAMDMIVPFIPLRQEAKCEIKQGNTMMQIKQGNAITQKSESGPTSGWLILKAVYSVIGWIVFSLCLGTFSGLLKRPEGEG